VRALFCLVCFAVATVSAAAEDFIITIRREHLDGNLLVGSIFVNRERLGPCYERNDVKIAAGIYPCSMRYVSSDGHAQGPFGELAQEGDFLLEIRNVKWSDGRIRKDLLLHAGDKPGQSTGCIMLGAVRRDSHHIAILPPNHPLRLLRLRFYGNDTPVATPDKKVSIVIVDEGSS
jgi:hypothetical protein